MKDIISKLLTNWQTTSAGLTLVVYNTIHLLFAIKSGTANENTWTISLSAILGGLGLMFAGDANKSAQIKDVEQVKQQMASIPSAINTGDTSVLQKSITDATKENKQ